MIRLEENQLKLEEKDTGKYVDGLQLSESEQQYLLPHFLMLLVGKPGSGKTTVMKQLLTNKQMYKNKFDHVFLISPSFGKMGLPLKQTNVRSTFSLDWIYSQIEKISSEQIAKQHKGTRKQLIATKGIKEGMKDIHRLNQNRLLPNDILLGVLPHTIQQSTVNKLKQKAVIPGMNSSDEVRDQQQHQMMKELDKMSPEERQKQHVNVLFVLDDVVGDIKRLENDPKLAQLIMNRRHLVHNGTISIMLVTQKYTLIPARIRSNANWLILFKLNPLDFETVYKDAITKSQKEWQQVLDFVFEKSEGTEEEEQQKKKSLQGYLRQKKYDNLGIWVEYNFFFKNFKRLVSTTTRVN